MSRPESPSVDLTTGFALSNWDLLRDWLDLQNGGAALNRDVATEERSW